MKIIRTDIDLCRKKTIVNAIKGNFIILLVKSPAVGIINDERINFGTNTAIVFSVGSITIEPPENGAQLHYDCVAFSINAFGVQYIESFGIPVDKPFEICDDTVIRSIIRCIHIQEFADDGKKNDFYEAAMHMLFIAVSEQINDRVERSSSEISHYKELYAIRNNIYADPAKPWSVDEICMKLNISNTYFHRLYFAAFGITCRQDIINSRLALAERLLAGTDKTIGSIAEYCGYDNDSYFMRQFKQHRGYTPSEYRRRFKKNILCD